MRIGETAVMFDAPFLDLFHMIPSQQIAGHMTRWGFNAGSDQHTRPRREQFPRKSTTQSRHQESHSRAAAAAQSRPREIIIPIQIEGRSQGCSAVTEIPERCRFASENQNNNGTHGTHPKLNGSRRGVRKDGSDDYVSIGVPTGSGTVVGNSPSACSSRGYSNQKSRDLLSWIDSEQYERECPPRTTSGPRVYDLTEDDHSGVRRRGRGTNQPATSSCADSSRSGDATNHLCPDLAKRVAPFITDTPSYPVYGSLKQRLKVDGRQIDYIRGDGNCFFRALSKEIYGSEEFHDDIRQAVVDLVEKYAGDFKQFLFTETNLDDHIEEMRKASTWASTMEIYAAATLLQRDIFILSPDHTGDLYNWMLFSPRFVYNRTMTYHPCHIAMCHTHGNHYDRITQIEGDCNCGVETPTLAGKTDYVDLTV
ncbi:uncharacterized protein LOC121386243 [Gigantopelta aegis]|uniref:uncharacterized protein LOC121386243 n=1 Tax=Gigantopelta aegis TaxID=1735272 RepID=UPI001B88A54B|nr:uncharacterized protein LOC121386243 [Gigantopelta aegis]